MDKSTITIMFVVFVSCSIFYGMSRYIRSKNRCRRLFRDIEYAYKTDTGDSQCLKKYEEMCDLAETIHFDLKDIVGNANVQTMALATHNTYIENLHRAQSVTIEQIKTMLTGDALTSALSELDDKFRAELKELEDEALKFRRAFGIHA